MTQIVDAPELHQTSPPPPFSTPNVKIQGPSEKTQQQDEDNGLPTSLVDASRLNAAYDWTGPNDPDNPLNSPLALRVFSTIAIALLAMIGTVGGSMYAPAQNAVAKEFHSSSIVATLPLSLYNLGMAFGPLVGAPLSETYGRKAVFMISAPIFVGFLLGSGFAKSLATLVVCRFFAGVFASPLVSNAPATMLDFTPVRYRGVSLGAYYAVPSFGAGLGPLIGGYIVLAKDWRWTQYIAIILTVAAYIPVCFTRETYKKVIIQRRAVRLGLQDSASQRMSPGRAIRYFASTLIQRPLHMLVTEPIVTLVCLYNGFLFGLLYTFIVSVPWIFEQYYGFAEWVQPLSYLSIMLGTLSASVPLVLIDLKYYQPRLRQWQRTHDVNQGERFPSENRLFSALIGSLILPPCLFIAGWTVHYRVFWLVPMIFQALVLLISLLIYAGVNLFMLDFYGPLYGASASGAMMFSRYLLGGAFPLFALQMFQRLGVGWGTSLLGFITVAMAPIPWCFRAYGERLRERSKYESS